MVASTGRRSSMRRRGYTLRLLFGILYALVALHTVLCRSSIRIASREGDLSKITELPLANNTASARRSLYSDATTSTKFQVHECEKYLDEPSIRGPSRSCTGKSYVEWSQVSILIYKPTDVEELVEAASAKKVKEILVFEELQSQPNRRLIDALVGANHFIVFGSKSDDAALAFNKLGQMANSDLLVMLVGGQEKALRKALDSKVLNLFRKDKNLSLVSTSSSVALDGTKGMTERNKRTDVQAALFGPLVARRSTFMDSGMFYSGHSNECLQMNAFDLSMRLRNLGYAVASFPTADTAHYPNPRGGIDSIVSLANLNSAICNQNMGENVYAKREGSKTCYRASDFQASMPSGSFVVQYFKRSGNIQSIVDSFKKYKGKAELIINDDSRSDYVEWSAALRGWNAYLVYSPDIHEIRGYNRLTQFADSELMVYLQDDDLGAQNLDWLGKAKKLFENHEDMALLGGFRGRMDFGTTMDSRKHLIQGPKFGVPSANPRCCIKIPWRDKESGIPFMFVYKVNMGPMMARRSAFLKLGMYHPHFSCAGDPGIGFDYEFSIRAWKLGYKVGLTVSEFNNRVAGSMSSGTHSGPQKKIRDANEVVNNRAVYRMYKNFHHRQGTRKASQANKALKGPGSGYFSDRKADEAYKKTTRGYRRQQQRLKRGVSGSRLARWQQLQARQNRRKGGNRRKGKRSGL